MSRSVKKRNWRKAWLTIIASLVLVGIVITVYAGYLYNKTDAALKSISTAPTDLGAAAAAPAALEKPMIFLLTAVDNREGSDGSMNTDVMMLVSLNPITRAATVVSIPRDLELKPEKYGLSSHKANYYYAYYYSQDPKTAITRTKNLFSQLFQVPIDYMAVIDFDGFRKLVDELGGLQVNVDMNMRYTDHEDGTDINLKQGVQVLNGKQTLDFLRYRKSNEGTEESSDIERNERQQQVLGKLVDKLTSFSGIAQWGGILDIAASSMKTDIPAATLRNWLLSFRSLKPDSTEFLQLDGRWDSPYLVVKEEDLEQAMNALIARRQVPGQESTVTGQVYHAYSSVIGLDSAAKKR